MKNKGILSQLSETGRQTLAELKKALTQYMQGEMMKRHIQSCQVSRSKSTFLNQLEKQLTASYHSLSDP